MSEQKRGLDLPDSQIASLRRDVLKYVVTHSAILFGSYPDATTVAQYARVLTDFILGTNDAEVIGAVRELAKKVG